MTEATGIPNNTDFHHLALCKVGNEYGIYIGGTQVGYRSDSDIDTFAGKLLIGSFDEEQLFFGGWLDEIRIVKANVFNAAPVAGLTDTITVPSLPYITWG